MNHGSTTIDCNCKSMDIERVAPISHPETPYTGQVSLVDNRHLLSICLHQTLIIIRIHLSFFQCHHIVAIGINSFDKCHIHSNFKR